MYKRIAVAVDGSKTSDAALAEGIKLAKEMGASILLIHACEEMPVIMQPDATSLVDTEMLMQAIVKAGKALLQKNSDMAHSAGLAAETQLIETYVGRAGSEVTQAAQKWGADLLVVGTHGRKGFAHLLMGSVAENVMRTATMSVLLVRAA